MPVFARSVGFGPVFFPTQRGFVQRRVCGLPPPLQANVEIIVLEQALPDGFETPGRDPALEPPMDCGARAELPRHGLPLTAGAQHVEHPFEEEPRWKPTPTAHA